MVGRHRMAAVFPLALLGAVAVQWGFFAVGDAVAVGAILGGVLAYAAVVGAIVGVGAGAPILRPAAALAWAAVPGLVLTAMATQRVGASAPLPAGTVLVCLLAGGSLVGAMVGGRVEKAGYLSVVAYVSSLADLYSVLTPGAPSAVALETEALLSVLALPWPPLGTRVFQPVLGVGDVVMSALYLAAARRLGLGVGRMAAALALGYAACLGVLFWIGRALPALPFLALGVLAFVPASRTLPREERGVAALGMIALTLLFAVMALAGAL